VTVVRRAAKALAKETNRPVTGGRFFPDGSFELFVGEPAKAATEGEPGDSRNPWDEVLGAKDAKRSAG
jgi:hypothetical protein